MKNVNDEMKKKTGEKFPSSKSEIEKDESSLAIKIASVMIFFFLVGLAAYIVNTNDVEKNWERF